ncbi:MAG TPA: hypothetical protein VET90_04740, partial [Candidatus Binatus sp.]|nr:hypothetical protein [Candidatus Binatus sp.]
GDDPARGVTDQAARASLEQLVRESQAINDKRRSLHRRREQTRLLARPTVASSGAAQAPVGRA